MAPASDLHVLDELTMHRFVENKLPNLGLHFKVWDWTKAELYGITLGSFILLGLVPDNQALNRLLEFIVDVSEGYFDNPYHSFNHAVDVMYMTHYILIDLGIGELLDLTKVEITALFIAALTHDILHPGLNNLYHINAKTDLALKYNNESVLENLSCDRLKELLDKHDFLDKLDYGEFVPFSADDGSKIDQFMYMKVIIADAIKNTDMCYHFHLLNQLPDAAVDPDQEPSSPIIMLSTIHIKVEDDAVEREEPESLIQPKKASNYERIMPPQIEQRRKMVNILLHAADISNAARPFDICKKWSDMIVEEFFQQGEQEAKAGIPISPSMDRATTSQVKISIQFNDLIARPFFEALSDVLEPMDIYVKTLQSNRIEWVSRLENAQSIELEENAAATALARGRRMSTAAGMIDLPVVLFGRPNHNRNKRHSFCALTQIGMSSEVSTSKSMSRSYKDPEDKAAFLEGILIRDGENTVILKN